MNQLNPIIVLGMHRSGTSAMSGVLSGLGFFMGADLFKPQIGVNDKGFFENSGIVRINERLFDELLVSWDDPLCHAAELYDSKKDDERIVAIREEAKKFILKEYLEHEFWGIKDPRTSIVMNFWNDVFEQLAIKPNFIVMLRHPAEVYYSLKKRDSFSAEKALILWIDYTLKSLQYSIDKELILLSYDDLMNSTETVVRSIVDKFYRDAVFDLKKVEGFINVSLKNNVADFSSIKGCHPELLSISTSLYNLTCQSQINATSLDTVAKKFNLYVSNLSPVLREHLVVLKASEVKYRNLFDEAYYSVWWKVTWPLRALNKLFNALLNKR